MPWERPTLSAEGPTRIDEPAGSGRHHGATAPAMAAIHPRSSRGSRSITASTIGLGRSHLARAVTLQFAPPLSRQSAAALCGVCGIAAGAGWARSEEHTSELQSRENLVCRLLL